MLWLFLSCAAFSVLCVFLLRWINPPFTAYMAEAQIVAWAKRDSTYASHHRWVDLNQISPNLPLAVIASEDQKFPEHRGFDVEAIEKAYELNQHSHRVRGASTISQQVAKNLFLWSGRSYFRKGLEAYFTLLIEACWPKRRILEIYLNAAEFGYGTYGAEAAAQRYFHRPAARLSRNDAALLAAVLPNPKLFSAAMPSAYIQRRRDAILVQMQALGGAEMLDEIDAYPDRRR
ncbi:MAG: monofunctional biosynthetic peptidoglycan transglycosylase [Steroidobacteraceae bacterium]